MLMRHVAVGENDLIDCLRAAQFVEFRFGNDRNAIGIQRAGKRWRITTAGNAGDLRCSEGDDLGGRIIAKDHVEIMEIASCGADNDNAATAVITIASLRPSVR